MINLQTGRKKGIINNKHKFGMHNLTSQSHRLAVFSDFETIWKG